VSATCRQDLALKGSRRLLACYTFLLSVHRKSAKAKLRDLTIARPQPVASARHARHYLREKLELPWLAREASVGSKRRLGLNSVRRTLDGAFVATKKTRRSANSNVLASWLLGKHSGVGLPGGVSQPRSRADRLREWGLTEIGSSTWAMMALCRRLSSCIGRWLPPNCRPLP